MLHADTIHHDIYVIGSQEAVESIGNSMFNPSKQLIIDSARAVLGPDYWLVHSVSLQATHMVIFASFSLAALIEDVETQILPLGFNNTMGNKGALKIAFKLAKTRICFINCHLHSG